MDMSHHNRRGMTILELLVVVGIMAILFALITSAISRVRNSAQTVSCASNEHQIFSSLIAFAADHSGYLPVPGECGTVDFPAGNGPFVVWAMDANHPEGGTIDLNTGTLWPYLPASLSDRQNVVRCPADINAASTYGGTLNIERNFSYSFNANIGHPNGQVTSMALAAIVRPAAKILIYEENAPNDSWNCSDTGANGDDLPSGRHGTGSTDIGATSNHVWYTQGLGNFCFFDGHIETLTPEQIIVDEQTNTNSRWYPLTQ